MIRPVVRLGVVGGVVAAVVVAGTLLQGELPQPDSTTAALEPVGSSVLLCPEPGTGNDDLGVRVTAVVVPGLPGQDRAGGSAVIQTLPGKESAKQRIEVPGGQAEVGASGRKLPPIEARATGALAPGFIADQWSRKPRGIGRGMGSTACAPAGSDFWFVGGGAVAGRQTRVVLVNPDDNAAVVDITVIGPDGVIEAPAGRGLVVKPNDRLIVRLDVLVPGVKATAFHVQARSGRVGAAVDDVQMSGLDAVGTDWIPVAAAPATTVYVPGVFPGKGARVLSVAAPGEDDALVSIEVMTNDGTFPPADRDSMRVPAGTVQSMDLSTVIEGDPATIKVTSEVPVVAGLRQFVGGRRQQNETAFSAGAQPFAAASAVSGLPVRPATTVHVGISAPDSDVVADITLLPFTGGKQAATPTAPRRVTVQAGRLRWIELDAPAGAAWYTAVITPAEGSGPMVVAHRVREASRFGDLVTGYPWSPLRVEVSVPQAQQDLSVTIR